jgi:hypothetical protein
MLYSRLLTALIGYFYIGIIYRVNYRAFRAFKKCKISLYTCLYLYRDTGSYLTVFSFIDYIYVRVFIAGDLKTGFLSYGKLSLGT